MAESSAHPGGEEQAADACSLSIADLLSGMPGGFMVLGRGLRVHLCNDRVEEIIGPPVPGEVEFVRAWPAVGRTTLTRAFERALEAGGEVRHEAHLPLEDRWVEALARSRGGLLHVHLQDITHRKHSEAQVAKSAEDLLRSKAAFEWQAEELSKANVALREARAAAELARVQAETAAAHAEAASSAKSSFLANMSHEIRTPMTAIVGFADMMLEPGQTNDQRQDCLQTIRRNARHLLDLINGILDISKIEAGKMVIERIEVDLPRLVAEVVSMMRPRCLEKGLDFQLLFDGPVRRTIRTDPLRLRQILVNLLGNAVKFTAQGMVMLRVRCTGNAVPGTAGDQTVRFEVLDTGIGIPADVLPRLFDPFEQQDASTTRQYGGTGLGLTISRRLAHMLGGDIAVSSDDGRGSTFVVDIDGGPETGSLLEAVTEAEVPKPPQPAAVPESLGPCSILLVEDGKDNQRLFSTYLKRAGATVTVADNGQAAIAAFEEAGRERRAFDLVLMDMQMPVLDGYAATSELRRRGITVPVIAITAHAMSDDRDRCLAAGCTDYLTKPIDKGTLLSTIAQHLARSAAADLPKAAPVVAPRGDTIVSTFTDDPEMAELIANFVAGLPATVERLPELFLGGSTQDLVRSLHQLKGTGGSFGFHEISRLAARAEAAVKAGAPDAIDAVKGLIHGCRRVEGYRAPLPPAADNPGLRKTA